ncbi:unnamed protein product [Phytomonas sp. EM1]|nr:unnamed protein product [Phytomonas sp. EM1]|eukprot:CCW59911.1 unnamed protein product [Phytomonas sp. isolate EM1]
MDFAFAVEADEIFQGGWNLRVLSPGRSSSPSYVAWVERDTINITKLNSSGMSEFFSRAVGLLRMVNFGTPRELDRTFHLRHSLDLSFVASKIGDTIDVHCNPGLMHGMNFSQLLIENGHFSKYFNDILPVHTTYDNQCIALPWGVEHISVHYHYYPQMKHFFTFTFVLQGWETKMPRIVAVEATPFPRGKSKREGSLYGPLWAIVVLVILRALPRYFMKQGGCVGRGLYRSAVRPISASERRKLVREKCEEIIRKMKDEDGKS